MAITDTRNLRQLLRIHSHDWRILSYFRLLTVFEKCNYFDGA